MIQLQCFIVLHFIKVDVFLELPPKKSLQSNKRKKKVIIYKLLYFFRLGIWNIETLISFCVFIKVVGLSEL